MKARFDFYKASPDTMKHLFGCQKVYDASGLEPRLLHLVQQRASQINGCAFCMHMHAGDGNIHTNIPVHSDNYAMLQEADRIVERVMELARNLGGVISGEHGIGSKRKKYMNLACSEAELEFMRKIKRAVDPNNVLNPGKIVDV